MQVGPLLEALEVGGALKVVLHHIKKTIVVVDGASGIFHQQSPSLSQCSTDLAAKLTQSPVSELTVGFRRRQVIGQIDHREVHYGGNRIRKI